MAVTLSEDELWAFVTAAHTGIVTTLRRDGRPVPLPVWFVVLRRRIYVTTPDRTHKVTRVRHDERAAFLVESGTHYRELTAAMIPVRARLLGDDASDGALRAECAEAMEVKYGAYRAARAALPGRTRERLAHTATIELVPTEGIVSWDNARLRPSPG